MQKAFRSVKNQVKQYDEGQRMVRELTSNTDTIPTQQQLAELVAYCRNDMVSTPTYDVLWKRLTDYQVLRHVEKSLLVIEHLILNGNRKFIRVCAARRAQFEKLSKYVYKIDGSDIGQNVRRRAKYIGELLTEDANRSGNGAYSAYNNDSKRASGMISSYDDYFATADKQDAANAARLRAQQEKERREKEDKEERERQRELRRQKSDDSDDSDSEDEDDEEELVKPKKKKGKKKKRKKKKTKKS